MTTVTLTLIDDEDGMRVKFVSDPGLPDCEEDETLAQTLGLLSLETVKKQFRDVTGYELEPFMPH